MDAPVINKRNLTDEHKKQIVKMFSLLSGKPIEKIKFRGIRRDWHDIVCYLVQDGTLEFHLKRSKTAWLTPGRIDVETDTMRIHRGANVGIGPTDVGVLKLNEGYVAIIEIVSDEGENYNRIAI